jgi:hypothetical protein
LLEGAASRDASFELINFVKPSCARPARAVRTPAIALALMGALAAVGAWGADGREGGAQLGCGSVIDGRGNAVSGKAGTSVSTRLRKECPSTPPPEEPRASTAAPREQRSKQSLLPVPERPAAPVSILSGQVSLPPAAHETPSALRGDLVRASATVVTGGVLIWFLQSSLWASLLVLGVPIWRHVDLLPVLSNAGEADRETGSEAQEDAALAHVLEAGSRAATIATGGQG